MQILAYMGKSFNAAEDIFKRNQDLTGQSEMSPMEDSLLEPEEQPFVSLQNEAGASTNPFLLSFLGDLIPCIKNQLWAVKNLTSPSGDRCEDPEFRKSSQQAVTEKIKQIDSVLNSLLNYININTPVIKTNTLRLILEEVLEANGKQLQEKNIRVIKKSEKDLPETYIHDEQVRFILNSILQYAIHSAPLNGSIGFLFRTSNLPKGEGNHKKTLTENPEGYVEVIIIFTCNQKATGSSEPTSPSIQAQREEVIELILQLVEEILEKNDGMMKWEVDEKRSRSLISLRFPIERRKVIYYERINV
jgi:signal transduction histidine kinase